MMKGFERHDRELERLREDMRRGFELVERHISALGARWGLMAEEAFREGLKGFLEKELKLSVERWVQLDGEGIVYGYPSTVEIGISISDERTTLIEISSHIKPSDMLLFVGKSNSMRKPQPVNLIEGS